MNGARPQPAADRPGGVIAMGRSPLAHLLHALNQPLTGLQCSLELATSGPRTAEQYARTLREGLELTGRMRILVEALRELADTDTLDSRSTQPFLLNELLREVAESLRPVAECNGATLVLESLDLLPVHADRGLVAAMMFRWIEATLSLASQGSDLRVAAVKDTACARISISWNAGPRPEHSPFSRPELGLLIAQAVWERLGGEWRHVRHETEETCTARLLLAEAFAAR